MTKITLDRLTPVEPDKDGCYNFEGSPYESEVDYLQTGLLDFCGCGSPEDNLKFIRDAMNHMNHYGKKPPAWGANDSKPYWEKYRTDGLAIFGNASSQLFFGYWLDTMGLSEHGGSVPGWLNPAGVALLKILNKANLEND